MCIYLPACLLVTDWKRKPAILSQTAARAAVARIHTHLQYTSITACNQAQLKSCLLATVPYSIFIFSSTVIFVVEVVDPIQSINFKTK